MTLVVLNADGTLRSVNGVPWPPRPPLWATSVSLPHIEAARAAVTSQRYRASVTRAVAEAVTS